MITDPYAHLELPFPLEDHLWLQGNPYIKKDAIRRRLTTIDPHWSITEPRLVAESGDIVIMTATLTVLGSARSNVGTGVIQHAAPDTTTGEISVFNEAKLLAKAYKSAASDLLPRCAQQFGVGWYLLNMSKTLKKQVESPDGLRRYLLSLSEPLHWSLNGGGQRFMQRVRELRESGAEHLTGDYVLAHLEPAHALEKLSDTTLTEADAMKRLEELSA